MAIRIRHLAAAAALLLAQVAPGTASAELVVIVSARNPLPALSGDQVAAIFLGQAGRFPDGLEAVALDQRLGTLERNQFYAQVTGKSPALLKAHWSKMVFTGRGQPPREAADSAAVRRMVADNPSMIGYIDRAALDASVRPVLILR
ncbi:phosphate ABC transporter substrate-binding protein [Massilia sp. IC2-477]|uniref:phosphate ABC transporter substrate-binding protein n=1 Tax=unclassified Massilia TaxID=2609279 RepID=UPI001D10EE0F|nr:MULTISPECIES: phosphate ABC transporter substrate-binding protein [unclassified Massilia]MCC2956359.1 phosphate ABC transporter substrate-binding protein [Massilia sp. IC2-477]MCC2972272.1 phosphate ABC transporter substrate-binding protein [Massilia sp. IC2-476]